MLSFFRTRFFKASDPRDVERETTIMAAIEHAVDGTDPRLRIVSGYKKKLREAVQAALAHADEVVEGVQGPVEISKDAYSADPLACAFFATADALRDFLKRNRTMKAFLEQSENRRLPECYALLGMEREEKSMFGTELEGEIVKRDVLKTSVNFTGHRIIAPAATERELREEIKQRAFNQLVKCALARIASLRSRREELAEEKTLLQIKLNAIQHEGRGLEALTQSEDSDDDSFSAARRQLREVEQKLTRARARIETLDDYLTQIRAVLAEPEKCLSLTEVSLRINRMGIMVAEQSSAPADEIRFQEVRIGETLPVAAVVVAKIPQSEWQ